MIQGGELHAFWLSGRTLQVQNFKGKILLEKQKGDKFISRKETFLVGIDVILYMLVSLLPNPSLMANWMKSKRNAKEFLLCLEMTFYFRACYQSLLYCGKRWHRYGIDREALQLKPKDTFRTLINHTFLSTVATAMPRY